MNIPTLEIFCCDSDGRVHSTAKQKTTIPINDIVVQVLLIDFFISVGISQSVCTPVGIISSFDTFVSITLVLQLLSYDYIIHFYVSNNTDFNFDIAYSKVSHAP